MDKVNSLNLSDFHYQVAIIRVPAHRTIRIKWDSCAYVLSHVWLFATPWTVTCQAPLSLGFPRQGYWSRLPFPSPGDLPDPGVKLLSSSLAFLFIAFTYYIPVNTVWIVQSLKRCMSLYPGQRKIIQRPSAGLGMYIQWYQKYMCMSK